MTGADLSFDAEHHEYRLPSGVRVPSVTEILRATGVSQDFEALAARDVQLGQQIAYARALGTAVHADCHSYDDCALDVSAVNAAVRPFLDAWIAFRENVRLRPVYRERRIYHPDFQYAGTIDGLFQEITGPRLVLIDIKTGDPEASACRYQTAAYVQPLLMELAPLGIMQIHRMAVQLCPDRAVPYRITHYSYAAQRDDFRKFSAFLTTYHAQYSRRTRTEAAA